MSMKNINTIKLDNNLFVKLNENDLTAEIVKSKEAKGDIIIPKSVKYNSKLFIIKSISSYSFEYNHFLNSLSFAEGSEVQSIGKNAFYHCYIKSLTLPAHFCKFDNEWIQNTLRLTNIDYSPENKYLCKVNKTFLLFKKDQRSNDFDSLIFAPRNITGKIEIPLCVKRIGPFSFNLCHRMTSLLFPQASLIQEIDLYAFYKCYNLKSISSIPTTCTKIGRWCFAYSNHLSGIEFLGEKITLCVGCFSRCSSLVCVSFPNGNEINVCDHVFDRVTSGFSLFTKTNAKIVRIYDNI